MIDAHNHLQDSRFLGKQDQLIAQMKAVGITGCVVNGTSEADWPAVSALAEKHPDFIFPAFGLHPWKIDERSPVWLETLLEYLQKHPTATLGECGLDRWIKNPDLDAQHLVFQQQLDLALRLDRPVTIHCLKAWGPLLQELRNLTYLPKFLLHSFNGSLETAQELLPLGAHFSFSGHFLHPRKEKLRQTFAQLPPDRLMIETDAPDMTPPNPKHPLQDLNHPANLPQVAKELTSLTKVPIEQFTLNALDFFD